jgi:two-component system heavy metal sensor histidine kinase CusS
MKLWHRLALAFSGLTTLAMLLALSVTLAVFKHAQERGLDEELFERAATEAAEVTLLGGRRLNIEQAPSDASNNLVQLVKYGAVFAADGTLITHTVTFGDRTPALVALGYRPGGALPFRGFDFVFGEQILRGVLVRVHTDPPELLLLAAPRDDLDSDVLYLLRAMAMVFCAVVLASAGAGLWLGARLTRGIKRIAQVARRVSEGELGARVDDASLGRDREIVRLGGDLNQMITRTQALLEAERRFVSNAAHELRSPLSALRGELELALRHPRTVEAYRAAIDEALGDTNRLVDLAEDLLTLARVSALRAAEPVAAAAVVAQAIAASGARHQAAVDTDVEPVWVIGQSGALVRLLRNLIDNAATHAPEGSPVRVSVHASDGWVRLAVEDDGAGVEENVRQRMFEPFARGSLEREASGAGLGLAIARDIARAHGGELRLESPAHPTRFVALLPAVAAASAADE